MNSLQLHYSASCVDPLEEEFSSDWRNLNSDHGVFQKFDQHSIATNLERCRERSRRDAREHASVAKRETLQFAEDLGLIKAATSGMSKSSSMGALSARFMPAGAHAPAGASYESMTNSTFAHSLRVPPKVGDRQTTRGDDGARSATLVCVYARARTQADPPVVVQRTRKDCTLQVQLDRLSWLVRVELRETGDHCQSSSGWKVAYQGPETSIVLDSKVVKPRAQYRMRIRQGWEVAVESSSRAGDDVQDHRNNDSDSDSDSSRGLHLEDLDLDLDMGLGSPPRSTKPAHRHDSPNDSISACSSGGAGQARTVRGR